MQLLHDCTELHLGDCVGADKEAWDLATMAGIRRVGHPPDDPKARAFLEYDEERRPYPYMVRNAHIARDGVDGVIATPSGWVELRRGSDGGTWSTVRRARNFGRRVWIVRPDGSVVEEHGRDSDKSERQMRLHRRI